MVCLLPDSIMAWQFFSVQTDALYFGAISAKTIPKLGLPKNARHYETQNSQDIRKMMKHDEKMHLATALLTPTHASLILVWRCPSWCHALDTEAAKPPKPGGLTASRLAAIRSSHNTNFQDLRRFLEGNGLNGSQNFWASLGTDMNWYECSLQFQKIQSLGHDCMTMHDPEIPIKICDGLLWHYWCVRQWSIILRSHTGEIKWS